MDVKQLIADYNLELFVRDVFVFQDDDRERKTLLPFFADGYPGIIYQQSDNPAFQLPWGKELTPFFLYGQTIEPIELSMNGAYRLLIFQLYPFASKVLFNVNPKSLNNDCYNLLKIPGADMQVFLNHLVAIPEIPQQLQTIARFISSLARKKGSDDYSEIQRAIELVVEHKGLITVSSLALNLNISERTLQRKFETFIGISPKKFAKIIQCKSSVEQITAGDFTKLTDVAYENGYADQSHLIRNIKKFTGKRPRQFTDLA